MRFRVRAISNDLDKKLVDRTVELAKTTGGFGWKQLRVALDCSPLHGAGRVEDTWNLIGRAMSKVVHAVSLALGVDEDSVIQSAKLTVLKSDSIKAALDIDWDDDEAQLAALQALLGQVDSLERWVARRAAKESQVPPLKDSLDLLRRIVSQDIEPDPSGRGRRIKEEVAKERVISVADPEMRHGRKSKTKLFNGYKRHIAIANNIILATAVEPANVQEHAPTRGSRAASRTATPLHRERSPRRCRRNHDQVERPDLARYSVEPDDATSTKRRPPTAAAPSTMSAERFSAVTDPSTPYPVPVPLSSNASGLPRISASRFRLITSATRSPAPPRAVHLGVPRVSLIRLR